MRDSNLTTTQNIQLGVFVSSIHENSQEKGERSVQWNQGELPGETVLELNLEDGQELEQKNREERTDTRQRKTANCKT